MALYVPGPLASVLSGKVGGTVFSRNKGGAYARTHAIPTTVTTPRAQLVKTALATVTQNYNSLDPNQRQAWVKYAANKPVTNRVGMQQHLTAQNWYVACNSRLLLATEDLITLPPLKPSPLLTFVSNLTVNAVGPVASVDIDQHPDSANVRLVIYGARSVSPGRQYVENVFTHIKTLDAGDDGGTGSFGPELEAALGSIQAGVNYHVRCQFLDTETGLVSASIRLSTVAVSSP